MVPAETKRASRNARFTRTRNALEHIHSEVVRSRTRRTFLSLSFTKKRKERESAQKRAAKRRREKTETSRLRVLTSFHEDLHDEYVCLYACFCASQKWRKRFDFHFVGENDINVSRTQRDRKRASLSPNSKATTQDCSSRSFFPSRSK